MLARLKRIALGAPRSVDDKKPIIGTGTIKFGENFHQSLSDMIFEAVNLAMAEIYRRDLQLVYAIRNTMAHSGRSEPLGQVTHYLMNAGIEILKAAVGEIIGATESQDGSVDLDAVMRVCDQ